MKTEYLSLIVAFFALLASIAGTMFNMKKSNKGDSVEMGRVLEKLDTISADMKEIKADARETKDEFYAQSVKFAELETRVRSIEKTIFKKEGEKNNG